MGSERLSANKGKYTEEERKARILKFCAYRERCHNEVRIKLLQLGASYDEADRLIVELIEHDFLNEERYARMYCRGKFIYNKWGRLKIEQQLRRNQISNYCINKGMKEINKEDYLNTLSEILNKAIKAKQSSANSYAIKDKAAKAAIVKGYEPDLVWELLRDMGG